MRVLSHSIKTAALIVASTTLIACSGTPPKDLGMSDMGELRPCPDTPNCELTQFANVQPSSETSIQQGLEKLKSSIEATGGKLISVDQSHADKVYLNAEYTSLIMRYIDDVECVITKNSISIRSASRLGHSDFGVNAARVSDIITAFNAE